ncbi:hypothetical protein D3C71_1734220 [compost metagenome]
MRRTQQAQEAAVEIITAFGVGVEDGTENAGMFQRIEADGRGLCVGAASGENGGNSGRAQEGHGFQNSILSR